MREDFKLFLYLSVYRSVSIYNLHTECYTENPPQGITHLKPPFRSQIMPNTASNKQNARTKACERGEKLTSNKWPV